MSVHIETSMQIDAAKLFIGYFDVAETHYIAIEASPEDKLVRPISAELYSLLLKELV